MFRSSSSFDRLLDRATSNLLLEPDWPAIMGICDAIRSGETAPKYAVSAIKKKLYHENPHVVIYSLQVIESCVKNCGSLVHDEVCTKNFMEELRELVKHTTDESVKKKILEMLQAWGMAFRNSQKYRVVTDTLNVMKAEGWEFPPVREAEAMFEADNAPDWADGDVCHRCRVQFSMMTRQHHCRACGQVFCGKCSSKSCAIPKFGIEKGVRVCDSCYEKYGPKNPGSPRSSPNKSVKLRASTENDLPAEYLASSLSQEAQSPPAKSGGKTDQELKEEEELQLAIALSQSEAQAKEDAKRRSGLQSRMTSEVKQQETKQPTPSEDVSPELMRYLNRDYWEQKEREKVEKKKSSTGSPIDHAKQDPVIQSASPGACVGANEDELDEFVTTLRTQVEIFVNRMKSNSSRGRSITNDSSVQTLFMNTMAMHSKLLKHIQDQEDKRVYYEGLQDKLTQVKDARAALDALREEERERKRREAEEAERLRQIQMREKLELMRKKKQEYLQYQRQLALQKMQEQEREMKLRQEQAKQQYMMQAYGAPPPGMYQPAPMGVSGVAPPYVGYPGVPGPQSYMPQQPGAPDQAFNMSAMSAAIAQAPPMQGQPQGVPQGVSQGVPPPGPMAPPPIQQGIGQMPGQQGWDIMYNQQPQQQQPPPDMTGTPSMSQTGAPPQVQPAPQAARPTEEASLISFD